MKNKFQIFQLTLACLLAIFIVGCSQDDTEETAPEIVTPPTPMEELTGKYTLATIGINIDGVLLGLEPPAIFGEMSLGANGGNWSLTFVATETGVSENITGTSWRANATTLTLSPDPPEPYTWDGTYLILNEIDDDGTEITLKFQKL